jgi:deoxyribose-phosphate aldolase
MSIPDPASLAKCIDHTFLKPDGGAELIERLCNEAMRYGFAAVMVHPAEVTRCVDILRGSQIRVGTVIGFPLGQNTILTKLEEAKECLRLGATELDMVINQRALKRCDDHYVRMELGGFAEICRAQNATSKIIIECCNLTDAEKIRACELVSEAGCSFIKTSTGFGTGGATVHDVALMRANASAQVAVKASGGIRNLEDAVKMLNAGATRLGTSSGVLIIEEAKGNNGAGSTGSGY